MPGSNVSISLWSREGEKCPCKYKSAYCSEHKYCQFLHFLDIPVTGHGGQPIGLREVKAPTLLRQTANRWRQGCQLYAPAALYPQVSLYFLDIPVTGHGGQPIGLREVEAPTLLKQTANRWRQGCQPYAPAALYPQTDIK
jgi:hypothetical protein